MRESPDLFLKLYRAQQLLWIKCESNNILSLSIRLQLETKGIKP